MNVDALLEWYERVRRPLPWRETRDPYALLVSEVMLQQTQALRVVPYYERWLDEFPDARTLAEAPVRDVLALWSGLGYNRRALALQRAALHVSEHGWPADLTELPGVGKYTPMRSIDRGRQPVSSTHSRRAARDGASPTSSDPAGSSQMVWPITWRYWRMRITCPASGCGMSTTEPR